MALRSLRGGMRTPKTHMNTMIARKRSKIRMDNEKFEVSDWTYFFSSWPTYEEVNEVAQVLGKHGTYPHIPRFQG